MSKIDKLEPLEFMHFWRSIAHQLGSCHLKINTSASNIHNFIETADDAKEFLKSAIKESYKRSHCDHLHSPVSIEHILDILGEIAYGLRNNHNDDLFDIELLEEIAWHISDRYKQHLQSDLFIKKPNKKCKGIIVSFPDHKIRMANSRF